MQTRHISKPEIISAVNSTASIKDAAKVLGVCRTTLPKLLRKYNIQKRQYTKYKVFQLAEIEKAIKDSTSMLRASRLLNISYASFRRQAKHHGVWDGKKTHKYLSKDAVEKAINSTKTMCAAAELCGVSIECFRKRAEGFGLYNPTKTIDRKTMSKEFVESCINSTRNMAEAARVSGKHPAAFNRHAKAYGLYKPNSNVKTTSNRPVHVPIADILEGKHPNIHGAVVKRKLIRAGYFEMKCETCGLTEWQGQPAPLQMDHIDGDNRNHKADNLRLLCPNCHALTPTFCGKVRKNSHSQNTFEA